MIKVTSRQDKIVPRELFDAVLLLKNKGTACTEELHAEGSLTSKRTYSCTEGIHPEG